MKLFILLFTFGEIMRKSLFALFLLGALSACASSPVTVASQTVAGNRKIASVYQCPDQGAAFEALLAQYQSCQSGYAQGCNNFCSGASVFVQAPATVGQPPAPVDVCHSYGRRQQVEQDLNASAMGQGPVHAYGNSEDECVQNALSSAAAFSVEDACNDQATCVKNCSVRAVGRPFIGQVRPNTVTISEAIKKDRCGGGGPVCIQLCEASLNAGKLNEARNACISANGVPSCSARIVSPINEYYNDGKQRCSAQVEVTPDAKVSCDVNLKATTGIQYGGYRPGRDHDRDPRDRDYDNSFHNH